MKKVSGFKVVFTTMHLVLLELGTYHCYLDSNLFNENYNPLIPRKFLLISPAI